MATASHITDSRAVSGRSFGARYTMETEMYILHHGPSGMFADQYRVDADGTIRTAGFAFKPWDDAAAHLDSIVAMGENADDWMIAVKPKNVVTDWIV